MDALKRDVLAPDVLDVAIKHALDVIVRQGSAQTARTGEIAKAIGRLDAEISRLTAAIAAGGDLDVIVNALRERQDARAALQADADRIAATGVVRSIAERSNGRSGRG